MNDAQKDEVISALVEFIKRASKEDATPVEITALPEVARILISTCLAEAFTDSYWPKEATVE